VVVTPVGEAEASEELERFLLRLGLRQPERLPRSKRHILHDRHVREEVVGLKDETDPSPHPVHIDSRPRDLLSADDDLATVDRLDQVDAAKERRLPRPGGTDEANDLVLADREVDSLQHLAQPERLVQVIDLEREPGVHAAAPSAN
jgi:hypothetical protein